MNITLNYLLLVSLLHLCLKIYKATYKIVNSAINYLKSIKSVLEQVNNIMNKSLNIHIQNHLVEGISKKLNLNFHISYEIILYYYFKCTRLISVSFDMSSISLKIRVCSYLDSFSHIQNLQTLGSE